MKFTVLVLTLITVFSLHSMDKCKLAAQALELYENLDKQEQLFSAHVTIDGNLVAITEFLTTVYTPILFLNSTLEALHAQAYNNNLDTLKCRTKACHQAIALLYSYAKEYGLAHPDDSKDRSEFKELIEFSQQGLRVLLFKKENQKILLQRLSKEKVRHPQLL